MIKRAYQGLEEPEYIEETRDYSQGTLIIYSSPKRKKVSKPKYGYKFVQTDKKK